MKGAFIYLRYSFWFNNRIAPTNDVPREVLSLCNYMMCLFVCVCNIYIYIFAQSAGAVEYTDCFSAEG